MGDTAPLLTDFITTESLDELLRTARLEDLSSAGLDITSLACVPEDLTATAHFVPRQHGIIAGLATLPRIIHLYDPSLNIDLLAADAQAVQPGSPIARIAGAKRSILAVERIALNLLTHLSGIATLTANYVHHTRGTSAKICDTRKTLPGLRAVQKYAVACGGGTTHRLGLYDAVLIKDNHLTHIRSDQLTTKLAAAIADAREQFPKLKFIEIEVDTLNQLKQVLTLNVDYILLDNMPPDMMRQAVALRNDTNPAVQLEASGGINLNTVRDVALTGVDRISVGALTHSAPSLDIGLDIPLTPHTHTTHPPVTPP